MRRRSQDLTKALLLAIGDQGEAQAKKTIASFVERFAPRFGLAALRRIVLDVPAVAQKLAGGETVVVETARPIDAATAGAAAAACGADLKTATIVTQVRPELLGGLRVRRPDKLFDATVRRRLDRARAALTR